MDSFSGLVIVLIIIFFIWALVKTQESADKEKNKIQIEKDEEIEKIRKATGYDEDQEKLDDYQKSLLKSLRNRGLKPTKKLLEGGEVTKQFYKKHDFRELDYVRQEIRYYRNEILKKKKNK